MKLLLLAVAVVAVVFILLARARKNGEGGADDGPWPFYAKKPLSPVEQVLYFRLVKALPDHIVLAQVGLSRLLGVQKGHNFGEWYNRINRMSADFVVCARDSTIVAVVELDDATHAKPERQVADAKKNKALAAAGVRLVRWQAKALPDESTIRATLR